MRVAVVGGGISGFTIIRKMLSHPNFNNDLTIDLFEKDANFVVGAPYSKDTKEAIMNEHAQDLSIFPESPDDFLVWLSENHVEYANNDAFVPREFYGDYLFERLSYLMDSEKVNIHESAIVDCEIDAERDIYRLQADDGQWHEAYQAVFFTIGHPPYADYYHLEGTPQYINSPVPIDETLAHLQPDQSIGIIGTGLSALDVVKYLLKQHNWTHPIRLYTDGNTPFKTVKFSRYQGQIQQSFSDEWIDSHRNQDGFISLEVMVETFLNDLKANDIDIQRLLELYGTGSISEIRSAIAHPDISLGKLRRYIVMMTIYLPDLYNTLTPLDRDLYKQKYERVFNHFRSQIPVESLAFILENLDQGRLEIVTRLKSIITEDDSYQLETENGESYHADYLINCTGFQFDIQKALAFDPLIKNLYQRDMLTPYYRGGAMVTWPDCQVVASRGLMPNMYLLGHWISKIHYGNNNIHLCIKQAERVAEGFAAQYGNDE